MKQTETYAAMAEVRAQEFSVRVGLGGFLALVALTFAPSWFPVVWFVAMACGQAIDGVIGERFIARPERVDRANVAVYLISSTLNAVLFGGLSAYFWFAGGEAGEWFALLTICGTLLHVSLKLYPSRIMLLSCGLPHAAYLVGIPAISVLFEPTRTLVSGVLVALGGLVYLSYLVIGARQSERALASLRAANAEAVAAREQAERASAAKSEFLATVSHEIRTPMNAVMSAAHLLRRSRLDEQQTEHVAMLSNAGDVLMSLLNDVLDISKIEAGKMQLEDAVLDLDEGLHALVRLWEPQAQAKSIALRLDAAADLPAAIRTDPLRLRQILFNLLSNAVKFTDAGEITLRAGRSDDCRGERLWFEVCDTGCGIDAEGQARLFSSFEQVNAGDSRRYGGTGLGLAISRRLAEMMGGSLGVSSAPGEGSVFRLELPLVEADPPEAEAGETEAPEAVAGRPLSILVAEDHEVNRRIVGMFLNPLGWSLTMVEDGAEAVEAAQAQAFDAILMDMQMPNMNGVDAARAIRDGGGVNAQTPVVALTANALGHHRELWAEVGVDAFLTKPIDPRLLVSTLLAAGARRAPASPVAVPAVA